mmetsp:Transcript_18707/g.36606  ORF Transcript_18707/g.36606 Transcript_18707/m.36606 type:complete len:141 (+) Transcript_18707:1914-2336(+)
MLCRTALFLPSLFLSKHRRKELWVLLNGNKPAFCANGVVHHLLFAQTTPRNSATKFLFDGLLESIPQVALNIVYLKSISNEGIGATQLFFINLSFLSTFRLVIQYCLARRAKVGAPQPSGSDHNLASDGPQLQLSDLNAP